MSGITITKTIELDTPSEKVIVLNKISSLLKNKFDYVLIENKNNVDCFTCRVKTKLFNPIVSIKGTIRIQLNDAKVKVMIEGDTKTNTWFWLTFVLGCFFPFPILLIMIYLYFSQKKGSVKSFEGVVDSLDFDIGKV